MTIHKSQSLSLERVFVGLNGQVRRLLSVVWDRSGSDRRRLVPWVADGIRRHARAGWVNMLCERHLCDDRPCSGEQLAPKPSIPSHSQLCVVVAAVCPAAHRGRAAQASTNTASMMRALARCEGKGGTTVLQTCTALFHRSFLRVFHLRWNRPLSTPARPPCEIEDAAGDAAARHLGLSRGRR
jgi:hypothetical protein